MTSSTSGSKRRGQLDGSQSGDSDRDRPAKKRRTVTPKERTTEYLDLLKSEDEYTEQDRLQMDRLTAELRKKKKIVVIAGAGMSVSAGIPDFRSSNGMFAQVKKQHNVKSSGKHLFDASVYKHDSSTQSFHNMVREMVAMSKNAKATPFHQLLASLAKEGRLLRLYSQNIDCIDTNLPPLATKVPLNLKGPWPATVQLHGGLEHMVCTKCGELSPFDESRFDGPEAPLCKTCKENDAVRTNFGGKRSHGIGRLRPRFVLYNEFNPDEEAIGNVSSADLRARPDAVLVVGTTLKVPGTRRLVKELCQVTRGRRDGFTVWINPSPEPKGIDFKDCWDLVVKAKCDDVASLVQLPPWDCEIGDDYLVPKEGAFKSNIEVSLPSKSSSSSPEQEEVKQQIISELQAIPTPRPSPKPAAARATTATKQATLFGKAQPAAKSAKANKPRARKPKQPVKSSATPKPLPMPFKSVKNLVSRASDSKIMEKANLATTTSPICVSLPLGSDTNTAELPSTPEKSTLFKETISPSSMPTNMNHIIDA